MLNSIQMPSVIDRRYQEVAGSDVTRLPRSAAKRAQRFGYRLANDIILSAISLILLGEPFP